MLGCIAAHEEATASVSHIACLERVVPYVLELSRVLSSVLSITVGTGEQ
jgi:hypothetical protein